MLPFQKIQEQQLQLPNEIYSFLPSIKSLLPLVFYGAICLIALLLLIVFVLPWLVKRFKSERRGSRNEKRSFEQRWRDLNVEQHFESDYTAGEYFGALSILLREAFEQFSGMGVTDMTAGEIQRKVFASGGDQSTGPRITKENVPQFLEFLVRSEQVQFANLLVTKEEATLWYQRVGQLISQLRKSQTSQTPTSGVNTAKTAGQVHV